MVVTNTLTMDDLLAIYDAKIVCQHVSGAASIKQYETRNMAGNADAIGAVHLLTYPADERKSNSRFFDASWKRAVYSMTSAEDGDTERDNIRASVENLVDPYLFRLHKVVQKAVEDEAKHAKASDCRLILYRNGSTEVPDYVGRSAFGKSRDVLQPKNIYQIISLSPEEQAEVGENKNAIASLLLDKLVTSLKTIRTLAPDNIVSGDGKEAEKPMDRTNQKDF